MIKNQNRQKGAVLFVALIMLLVVTLLAVSSMDGVVLESRLTSSRAFQVQQDAISESALREAEYRLANVPRGGYGLRDALEGNPANCSKSNNISTSIYQKVCVQNFTQAEKEKFYTNPFDSAFTTSAATGNAADTDTGLLWLPYIGTSTTNRYSSSYGTDISGKDIYSINGYWSMFLRPHGGSHGSQEGLYNAEYGAIGSGEGIFFHVITGQADDELAVQSAYATVALGLDN